MTGFNRFWLVAVRLWRSYHIRQPVAVFFYPKLGRKTGPNWTFKHYSWRPSRCPEAFQEQWIEKSGRLVLGLGANNMQVFDLWEWNKSTVKLTSPLPDMEGMLRWTASWPFQTMLLLLCLDMKNAYEQIRVITKHIPQTAVTTLIEIWSAISSSKETAILLQPIKLWWTTYYCHI